MSEKKDGIHGSCSRFFAFKDERAAYAGICSKTGQQVHATGVACENHTVKPAPIVYDPELDDGAEDDDM